jgi:site-specific DNA-cytosine methylase
MKILVACEESQTLTSELLKLGHDAYSCDLYESSGQHPDRHIKDDLFKIINDDWDLIFAFPPCTYLSRAQQFRVNKCHLRKRLQNKAVEFVKAIYYSPCTRIVIENPPGYLVHGFRSYDQLVQPYYFGDDHRKEICLWLKGLTPLPVPQSRYYNPVRRSVTNHVNGRMSQAQKSRIKSKFFPKLAKAMANHFTSQAAIKIELFQ